MSISQKNRHVVVIGAGIAGLSAASYLLRNGYRVTIVEKHSLPGGLCTSWKRKGFTIDYCIHWLMGTKKGTEFYRMWEELGAFDNEDGSQVPIVNFDDFTTITLSSGETVCLSGNLEKLREELIRIGPEDQREIDAFCKALKKMGAATEHNHRKEQGPLARAQKLLASIGQFALVIKHLKPMEEFAARFKNPKLQELFLTEIPQSWSLISLSMGLSQQPYKSAGYPVGGSLNIARNIERRVRELGGDIHYGAPVEHINVQDGKATGVRLSKGETIDADFVISAADGYTTLFHLLEGAFISKPYKDAYDCYPLFPSSVFIALGVKGDFSHLPHTSSPYFKTPIQFPDGTNHNRFNLNVYHYDPTLAPGGRTLITVLVNTWEGDKWEELATKDPKRYAQEKQRISKEVIDRLEQIIGPMAEQIEMVDISTPHSVIRYTGNWQGSYEGFAPTRATLSKRLPKTLPDLQHFAMIGQWTTPGGGLPTAAKDGLDIAKYLCKQDGKRFRSSV